MNIIAVDSVDMTMHGQRTTKRCIYCRKAAEYYIPNDLCRFHWADWFSEGDPAHRQMILDDLKEMNDEEDE